MSAGAGISVQLTLNAAQFRQQLGVGAAQIRNFVTQTNALRINVPATLNLAGWNQQAAQINQQIAQWQKGVNIPVNVAGGTAGGGTVGGAGDRGRGAGAGGGGGFGGGGFLGRGFGRMASGFAVFRTIEQIARTQERHAQQIEAAESATQLAEADIEEGRANDQLAFGMGRAVRGVAELFPGTTSLNERVGGLRALRQSDRDFDENIQYRERMGRLHGEVTVGEARSQHLESPDQQKVAAKVEFENKQREITGKYAKEQKGLDEQMAAAHARMMEHKGDWSRKDYNAASNEYKALYAKSIGAMGAQSGEEKLEKDLYDQKVKEADFDKKTIDIRKKGERAQDVAEGRAGVIRARGYDSGSELAEGVAEREAARVLFDRKQEAEVEKQTETERLKNGSKQDPAARAALAKKQAGERAEFDAKQEKEDDEARRQQTLAAARSRDRVADVGAEADEAVLGAQGNTEGAAKARLKRQLDDRVKGLREQAAAERDVVKSKQLSDEADAEEKAEPKRLAAQEIQFAKDNAHKLIDINENTRQAKLRSEHRYYEASEEARNADFDKRIVEAREAGHDEQADSLERQKKAAQSESDTEHTDRVKQTRVSAAAISQRALGHNASADLIGLEEGIVESERKATGDPDMQKAVHAENQAKLREFIHGERTPATYGDFESTYKQMQLTLLNGGDDKSAARAKARGLLDPNDPANAGFLAKGNAPGRPAVDFADLKGATKDLDAAAAKLNGAPIVGVIRP